MRATVLGAGAWGTALAQVLSDNDNEVVLWDRVEATVRDINENHRNSHYFGDLAFSPKLKATMDLASALSDAGLLVMAVPTFAVAEVTEKVSPLLDDRPYVVSVSKGFDPTTGKLMSETIRDNSDPTKIKGIVTLSGPSFAVEVVARMATAVTCACPDVSLAEEVQSFFSNEYFRSYSNDDQVGVELAGAIKNVIAVASGCLEGLGFKTNTRAALITRGLKEMSRFVMSQGGKAETLFGLAGVGDLVLTCSSSESRNFQVGYAIGKTRDAKKVLAENKLTAEGVKTSQIVHEKALEAKVDMPICESVYQVLFQGKDPRTMVDILMKRPLKAEHE